MYAIDYKIKIGTLQFKPGSNSRLIGLQSSASLKAPVNHCRMAFTVPADLSMAEGDAVEVELGYKDGTATIFTGIAATIEWYADKVIVEAESQMRQLTALRTNVYFENAFAGDIISALVGDTDLSKKRVEPGVRFAYYAIGSNANAWTQMENLAAQCGFDFYADVEDKVVFGMPLPAGAPALFQYGVNVLSLQMSQNQSTIEGVEVFGESPASFGAGPDAATWFTKSEVKGSAGSGQKKRLIVPAAREQQTAISIANNLWRRLSPHKTAQLRTLGKADLVIGAIVQISDMPADAQNDTYRITGVNHQLGGSSGFITTLTLETL